MAKNKKIDFEDYYIDDSMLTPEEEREIREDERYEKLGIDFDTPEEETIMLLNGIKKNDSNNPKIKKCMHDYFKAKQHKFLQDFFKITNEYADIIYDSNYETKTSRLNLTTQPTLHNAIKEISQTAHISVNEIIRYAIIKAIKEYHKKVEFI